jgi:hypothetical protein
VTERNDLTFVRGVLSLLADLGMRVWIFGGWAEELRGIGPPRKHADIDLIFPADDFALIDDAIRAGHLDEIAGKRFPHKRAFALGDVMVEVFLVGEDEHGLHTDFWGRIRHDWPADLLGHAEGLPVASARALSDYRRHYQLLRDGVTEAEPLAGERLR